MGCSPSSNRSVVSLQYPSEKERITTLGFSTTHAADKTFQSEHQGSGEIGTLLISLTIPVGQSQKKDRDRKESRDIREKDELGFRRIMTLQEGSKEFSFKAVTESCSSVDPKEMTFYRQSSGIRSSLTSYRNSMAKVDSSRKPSPFLLPRNPSEKHLRNLRRLDTCGDSLRSNQSPVEHLKIDNFTKSADELMLAFGSGSSLREDIGGGTHPSLVSSGSNVLLVVPEEGRYYENMKSEKFASSCHTSPKQYNNKNARPVRRISETSSKGGATPKQWPTIDVKFIRKESFTAQNESAYFGSPDSRNTEELAPEFVSPKAGQQNDEKKLKLIEVSQPSQEQQQQQQSENVIPSLSSFSQKRQAKLVLPIIATMRTSASAENLQTKPEIVPVKPDGSNTTKNSYKSQRMLNGRFRSESGVSSGQNSLNVDESPLNNLKSKFRANLLDLVATKKSSVPQSVNTSNQKHSQVEDGFDECLDDMSNISMRSLKSPPISNIRERDAPGEIFFKFDNFDSDIGMISPICSPIKFKRDFKVMEVNTILKKSPSVPPENRIENDSPPPPPIIEKSVEKSAEKSLRSLKSQKSVKISVEIDEEEGSYYEEDDEYSNYDFDNYTFIEDANGIEIDEAKGINIYDPKKPSALEVQLARLAQLKPHQPLKRSQFGARSSILAKSKSVNYDQTTLLSSPEKLKRQSKGGAGGEEVDNSRANLTPNQSEGLSEEGQDDSIRKRGFLPNRRHSKSQVIELGRLGTFSIEEAKIKKINQYDVGDEIGKGPIGEAYFGVDSETHRPYCVKIVNKDKIDRNLARGSEDFQQMQEEVAVLKKLIHPNIGKLYEVIDDPAQEKLYFISELINKEKIPSPQKVQKGKLPEEKIRKYFRELLLGIDYLHNSVGIIHGNLKPANVIISQEDTVKIVDCNISPMTVDIDTSFDSNDCKESYLPPEALDNEASREEASDVWGIGSMLYYFIYGKAPFSAGNIHGLERKIKEEEPEMPLETSLNEKITLLIEACLAKDPSDRPTLKEIMQHSWVTKNGQQPLFNKPTYDIKVTDEEVDQAVMQMGQKSFLKPNRYLAKPIEVISESKEDLNMPEGSLVIHDKEEHDDKEESP